MQCWRSYMKMLRMEFKNKAFIKQNLMQENAYSFNPA